MGSATDTSRDDLNALIGVERELEALLERARADAALRVDDARVRARNQEQAVAQRIAIAVDQVRLAVDASTQQRIDRERADAAALVARYDNVDVERLVDGLIHRLLELLREGTA